MKHKKIEELKNRHELTQQIATKIAKSHEWLVLRTDNEGLHLHTPCEDDLVLFAMFFDAYPQMHETVQLMLDEIKSKRNANFN